jgi:hypothetical protein
MTIVNGLSLPVVTHALLAESWNRHTLDLKSGLCLPDGIVDKYSSRLLREAIHEIMLLFKAETRFGASYDIIPMWSESEEDRAFLWAGTGGEEVPVIGACTFRHAASRFVDRYILNWVWFHRDERRKGRLTRAWPYFAHRFGGFVVLGNTRTPAMQAWFEKAKETKRIFKTLADVKD